MRHMNMLLIVRLILGIGASALILNFVTLLLIGASKSVGAIFGLLPFGLLLLYAIFMPKVHARIAEIWKAGGKGKTALIVVGIFLLTGIVLTIVESVFMVMYANRKAPESEKPPVVIVLGCQVRDGHPSTLLQARIDTAYDYLVAHPECKCIVSGGQGADETISEAKCMYDALVSAGIAPERLFLEDRSTTTRENLRFCKEIMEREGLGDTAVLVTNSWHEFRAQMIASDLDLRCGGVGAPTPWWLFPANYLREILAIVYQFIF